MHASLCRNAASLLLAAGLFLGAAAPAQAQSAVGSSKNIGVGLEAAHGAGLSVKVHSSASSAWQFGISAYDYGRYRHHRSGKYYYGYEYGYYAGAFVIHADYLMHQANLVGRPSFRLPWYFGAGADLGLGRGAAVGVHGNVGMALQFSRAPVDLFVEWTPRLWLVDFVQLRPVEFNGGIRFWF